LDTDSRSVYIQVSDVSFSLTRCQKWFGAKEAYFALFIGSFWICELGKSDCRPIIQGDFITSIVFTCCKTEWKPVERLGTLGTVMTDRP